MLPKRAYRSWFLSDVGTCVKYVVFNVNPRHLIRSKTCAHVQSQGHWHPPRPSEPSRTPGGPPRAACVGPCGVVDTNDRCKFQGKDCDLGLQFQLASGAFFSVINYSWRKKTRHSEVCLLSVILGKHGWEACLRSSFEKA